MESLLIVSNSAATMQFVGGLLYAQAVPRIATAGSGAEARRVLLESEFDLVVVDAPLSDEFGDDFAMHAAEFPCGVVLVVDGDRLEDMDFVMESSGVFVVPKPVAPEFFHQAVKLLMAGRRRLLRLEDENARLQQKVEELRLVDRAKCVLIQVLKMTEAQAHRYIEKQAMDQRLSRTAVAENVLRTYER